MTSIKEIALLFEHSVVRKTGHIAVRPSTYDKRLSHKPSCKQQLQWDIQQ